MSATRRATIAILTLFISLSVGAECATFLPPGPVVFVPLHVSGVLGANGSIWSSELAIHNASNETIRISDSCVLSACNTFDVAPQAVLIKAPAPASAFPGYFMGLATQQAESVVIYDRVFDETQSELNWGAYVPVVRWDELPPRVLRFINVPNLSSARHTLRVYAAVGGVPVVVRYFDGSGQLRATIEATLSGSECTPGYLQLGAPAEVGAAMPLRVEVESQRPELVLWGMLSITDATSRQITIIPSN
jgi:hypothetical protein